MRIEVIDSDILQVFIRLLYNPEPLFSHELGTGGPDLDAFKAYLQKHGLIHTVSFHAWDSRKNQANPFFSDLLKNHVMELPADGQPSQGSKLAATDKPKLLQFINGYITAFEKGILRQSNSQEYLSHKEQMNLIPLLWGKQFVSTKLPLLSDINAALEISDRLRYFELILSLSKNGFLSIESCGFRRIETVRTENAPSMHGTSLAFTLKFNTPPQEILRGYKKNPLAFFSKPHTSSSVHAIGQTSPQKIRLSAAEISFDDASATIMIGGRKVTLTPDTKQHTVCREMFKRKAGKWVSWDVVFSKAVDSMPDKPTEKNIRQMRDAVININKRVQKQAQTDDDLFSWKNNSIIRYF